MVLKKIMYFVDGKKKVIGVRVCDTIISKFMGLMFRKKSKPLLFVFDKEKRLSIHSLFCKPFTAIWLDEKMRATKVEKIRNWRMNIPGEGKYLLEISDVTPK